MSFSNPNYGGFTANNNYNPNMNPNPIVTVTNVYGVQVHPNNIRQSGLQQQHIEPSDEANIYTWAAYNRKNRAQSNSITSACMIASASGIHFSYIYLYFSLYNISIDHRELLHLTASWFIGVIIAAIVSAFLVRKFQKKVFNYLAAILTIANGIIFFVFSENYTTVIIGRYIAGISYGLIIVPVLMHSGEISVKKLRGSLVSNIHICFTIGILTGRIFNWIYFNFFQNLTLNIHQLCGIGIIIFGIISFIYNFFIIESPIYLIDKQRENDAFSALMKLRKEKFETPYRRYEFNDLKDMYDEDKHFSTSPLVQRNMRPLLLIGILRGLYALQTSMPINDKLFSNFQYSVSKYSIDLLIVTRLIAEIISLVLIDRKGRRHLLSTSMIISGVTIFLIGVLYTENIYIQNGITALAFFHQFFLGLGFGTVSLTYMTEAFPFVKKANSLLIIITFECLIHIFTVYNLTFYYYKFNFVAYFYTIGIMSVLYAFIIFRCLPETRNLSLRQCRNQMR